mmetsp:Transcript_45067/g.96154  ORF Transcript_45067/g.96154 Transcript_45067/m.96154 type:complete len:326 (-) Transcript_45067:518-1495(-)
MGLAISTGHGHSVSAGADISSTRLTLEVESLVARSTLCGAVLGTLSGNGAGAVRARALEGSALLTYRVVPVITPSADLRVMLVTLHAHGRCPAGTGASVLDAGTILQVLAFDASRALRGAVFQAQRGAHSCRAALTGADVSNAQITLQMISIITLRAIIRSVHHAISPSGCRASFATANVFSTGLALLVEPSVARLAQHALRSAARSRGCRATFACANIINTSRPVKPLPSIARSANRLTVSSACRSRSGGSTIASAHVCNTRVSVKAEPIIAGGADLGLMSVTPTGCRCRCSDPVRAEAHIARAYRPFRMIPSVTRRADLILML